MLCRLTLESMPGEVRVTGPFALVARALFFRIACKGCLFVPVGLVTVA
jgi:hypothetical protein